MPYNPKPLTGSLFKNDRMRDGKKDPEYTGSITGPDGEEYWLDAWVKNDRKAESYDPQKKTFFSLSLRPKDSRPERQAPGDAERGAQDKQWKKHDLSKPRHMPPPPLHSREPEKYEPAKPTDPDIPF